MHCVRCGNDQEVLSAPSEEGTRVQSAQHRKQRREREQMRNAVRCGGEAIDRASGGPGDDKPVRSSM